MDSMNDPGLLFPTDVVIRSDPAEARRVQEEIARRLKACQYSEHEVFSIKLAVEEALVNAMKHGNRMDPAKRVRVAYRVSPERFDVLIADEGPGFNPASVPDPTATENLERPGGRGLMLMRHYMNEVSFNACGNSVCMSKLRNGTK
jgi:serine/threonine-protein kinase RsbW